MPSKKRMALAGALSLLWVVVVDAAFDHHWPHRSALGWAGYVGGFALWYAGVWVVISKVTATRRRTVPGDAVDRTETAARPS